MKGRTRADEFKPAAILDSIVTRHPLSVVPLAVDRTDSRSGPEARAGVSTPVPTDEVEWITLAERNGDDTRLVGSSWVGVSSGAGLAFEGVAGRAEGVTDLGMSVGGHCGTERETQVTKGHRKIIEATHQE